MAESIINTSRVVPDHVAGPDALIVKLQMSPWGTTEFGLTFRQADSLADHLKRSLASFGYEEEQ